MLQTVWEWIVFIYVEEFLIPVLNNPIPFYLVVSLVSLLVSFSNYVCRKNWW